MLLWVYFASFWKGFLFLPAKYGKTTMATSQRSVLQYEYIEAIMIISELQIQNQLCIITVVCAVKKENHSWSKFFFSILPDLLGRHCQMCFT